MSKYKIIEKNIKEIIKWGKFDIAKLKRAGLTNYFQIDADGGTGGGLLAVEEKKRSTPHDNICEIMQKDVRVL